MKKNSELFYESRINLLQTEKSFCIMNNVELRLVYPRRNTIVIGGEIHAKY